jgi:hypothetical protein
MPRPHSHPHSGKIIPLSHLSRLPPPAKAHLCCEEVTLPGVTKHHTSTVRVVSSSFNAGFGKKKKLL